MSQPSNYKSFLQDLLGRYQADDKPLDLIIRYAGDSGEAEGLRTR